MAKGEPIMNDPIRKRMGRIALVGLFLLIPSSALCQETMAGFLREQYSCVMCHTNMRADFLEGVHSDRGIQCTDCHGGDPTQFEAEAAHAAGFQGALTKAQSVELCLSCHGDIPEMRQYALEPVTREEFLISRHGQSLLVEGNDQAPACSDCHGAHAIFPMVDPRSPIHPTQISATCAVCHANPERVPAGYPTDQYSDWTESAHGKALSDELNNRSANCASCHGSHSALPPGVGEIPNVCGKCHQLVRQASSLVLMQTLRTRGRGKAVVWVAMPTTPPRCLPFHRWRPSV